MQAVNPADVVPLGSMFLLRSFSTGQYMHLEDHGKAMKAILIPHFCRQEPTFPRGRYLLAAKGSGDGITAGVHETCRLFSFRHGLVMGGADTSAG